MGTQRPVLLSPRWGLVLYRLEEAQRREGGRVARSASHEDGGWGVRVVATGRVDAAETLLLRSVVVASGEVVGGGVRGLKAISPATPSQMAAIGRAGG